MSLLIRFQTIVTYTKITNDRQWDSATSERVWQEHRKTSSSELLRERLSLQASDDRERARVVRPIFRSIILLTENFGSGLFDSNGDDDEDDDDSYSDYIGCSVV